MRVAKNSLPLDFQKYTGSGPLNKFVRKEIYFFFCLGLTLFFYVALFSYNPADSGFNSARFPQLAVTNLSGYIGAYAASIIYYFVGLAGFILPLIPLTSAAMSLYHYQENKSLSLWQASGFLCLTVVCMVFLANYLQHFAINGFEVSSSGVIGAELFKALDKSLGQVGMKITLIMLSLISVTLLVNRSLIFGHNLTRLSNFSHHLKSSFFKNAGLFRKSTLKETDAPLIIEDAILEPPKNLKEIDDLANYLTRIELENQATTSSPAVASQKPDAQMPHLNETSTPGAYQHPGMDLLAKDTRQKSTNSALHNEISENIKKILNDFGVLGTMIGYQEGPVVSVYEYEPAEGVKLSKILSLADDLALGLKVDSIFMNPVRGKKAIGIQIPNKNREAVLLGNLLSDETLKRAKDFPLTVALGKSVNGETIFADLTSMPHLLMAGATGAGKSMAINSLLVNILHHTTPDQVRLILVDPKMLELSVYEGIPHLLMPVITDAHRAALSLMWAVNEMERRYKIMQHLAVRNLRDFNSTWHNLSEVEKDNHRDLLNEKELKELPIILIVIDELADLMMTAPKEVESVIQRLAQKARASGIHMVLATQRPSVDILTGVIKANLPCRIAFQVVSKHDSRTILDQMGAEKLLGKGDMLFMQPGAMRLERIQGPFISDQEIKTLVTTLKASGANYCHQLMQWMEEEAERQKSRSDTGLLTGDDQDAEKDEKYDFAVSLAQEQGSISASYLQRQFKIGYNRAARIIDHMEKIGLIDKADGVKPRKWLGR